MKAIYVSHGVDGPEVRMSPDSALVLRGNPWFLPADGNPGEWKARVLAAACVNRLGMHISEKFAPRYYADLTIVVHPLNSGAVPSLEWMRDGALVTGEGRMPASAGCGTVAIEAAGHICNVEMEALLNDFNRAIAEVSRYMTLKTGDMILLDIPIPEIALAEGVDFDVMSGGEKMLHFKTR